MKATTLVVDSILLILVLLESPVQCEVSTIISTTKSEDPTTQKDSFEGQRSPSKNTDDSSSKYKESCINKPIDTDKPQRDKTKGETRLINDPTNYRNPILLSPSKRSIVDRESMDSGKKYLASPSIKGGTVDRTPPSALEVLSSASNINRSGKLERGAPPKGTSIGIMPRTDEELLTRSLTLENKAENKTPREKILKKAALIPNNTEVVAQVGGTATLSCFTGHISDEVVTWLKREDDQLLTIGQELYANEARFSASISHSTKAWELFVRDVQLSDAGQYECQLTTHPPVTFLFSLKVTQAKAEIRGPREVHIEEGSRLDLQCFVKDSPNPPVYIFWYHNGTMVNYESQRGLMVHLENFTSNLVVGKVTPSDAGIYTCDPHLASRASVVVHVVTGERPAAMHGQSVIDSAGNPSLSESSRKNSFYVAFLLILPAFILQWQIHSLCSAILHIDYPYKKSHNLKISK